MSLDYKVFGRDSIFVAGENQQLGGFFSRIKKKLKKVVKKVIKLPVKAVKKVAFVINKNRKILKKIGAVAAIAYGGYMFGPKLLGYAKTLGGSSLAKSAGSKMVQAQVKKAIMAKYTPQQAQEMQDYAATMTPQQFMTDPEMQRQYQLFAQEQAMLQFPQYSASGVNRLLASEGAIEVSHQMGKSTIPSQYNKASSDIPVKKPSILGNENVKILLPAGIALLALFKK